MAVSTEPRESPKFESPGATLQASVLADSPLKAGPPPSADALRRLADYFQPALAREVESRARSAATQIPFPKWAEENFYIAETHAPIRLFPHQHVISRLLFEYAIDVLHCQTLVYSTVKKSGKALALDTRLPTPSGWVTMGNVAVGDILFDENGAPCRVTFATEPMIGHQCYEVEFSDGSTVIADAEHNWQVQALDKHYQTEIATTEQMRPRLFRRNDQAANFRIPVAAPIQTPEAELPIPPYTLGAWLGDGDSSVGRITCAEDEMLDGVAADGEYLELVDYASAQTRAAVYYVTPAPRGGDAKYRSHTLTARLRGLGLLGNKHIPPQYLRASIAQRLALLQGLMDTDGYVGARGECEISQKNETLSRDIFSLVVSLGLKPTVTIGAAKYYGQDCGLRHRIKFFAPKSFPVFRIARKLAGQPEKITRALRRHIVAIRSVESVPVRCVQVDSPSHLYLAGDSMIPTHNTAIGAAVARWIAETWGAYGEVFALANSLDQAKGRTFAAVLESLELDPLYDSQRRAIPGRWEVTDKQATFLPNNSIISAIASSHKGAAGSNPSASVYSELWGYQAESDKRLWAEMTPVPTRERSIRFVETYAGYIGESDILWNLYTLITKDGRQLEDSEAPDWPFPDDFKKNGGPGLPFYVNENAGAFAYWDSGDRARRMPWQLGERGERYYRMQSAELLQGEFDRLHKNEWVSSVSSFIPMEWWDRLGPPARPAVPPPPPSGVGSELILAADASVTGDCTALVGVRKVGDRVAIVLSEVWYPKSGAALDYSITLEPALRRLITGHIHPLHEPCATHSNADRLGPCVPTTPYNVVQLAYDAYQLHDMMTRFRNEGIVWARSFSQNNERMVADKQLYDMIRDGRLTHNGNPEFRSHVSDSAAKTAKDENTKLRIVKKGPQSKIDLTVAGSMATAECLRLLL